MNQRDALVRSLARSLVVRNRITTTTAKAKELRPFIERLVTNAKSGTLSARRLIEKIAPKYATRPGGYTRIIKLPDRKADAAPMALIEFV